MVKDKLVIDLHKVVKKKILRGLEKVALYVQEQAIINCPTVKKSAPGYTPKLRKTIRSKVDEQKLEAIVYTDSPYAPPVEYGCFFSNTIKILCREGWKKLKYIKIGDEVLTFKNGFKKIIDKPIFNINKKQIERISIITKNGKKLIVTGEHPFLIKTKEGYAWKKARELNTNDILIEVDL